MAEPARQPQGEVPKAVSEGADLVPFVGGGKQIAEGIRGRTLDGRVLTGRERLGRAALGAGNLALDLSGVGEVEKAGLAAGKVAGRMGEKQAAERAATVGSRSASRQADNVVDLRASRERLRSAPNQSQKKMQQDPESRNLGTDPLAGHTITSNEQALHIIGGAVRKTFDTIDEEFHKQGESFDEETLKKAVEENPPLPHFPFIMVSFAVLKDAIDFADFTVIGIIITSIVAVFINLIITVWSFNKMGGWWWKKYIITWFWQRFLFEVIVEIIPFGKIIPATTILVLMTHYRETKVVKLINYAFDQMNEAGIMKYIAK